VAQNLVTATGISSSPTHRACPVTSKNRVSFVHCPEEQKEAVRSPVESDCATAGESRPQGPLLAGYFGFGNAGDDMILRLLQARLGPTAFLSGPRRRRGEASVPRFHLRKIVRALRRSRALILGGGELFQSRTSGLSLAYYLMLPLLARALGRPTVGFSLALDPDLGRWGRAFTAFALRGAKGLWVRDETSFHVLAAHSGSVHRMPDVVWSWPVPPIEAPRSLRRVLWIPRFSSLDEGGGCLKPVFRSLSETLEQGLLAFHPFDDAVDLARFRQCLRVFHRLETWNDPTEIFDRISRYDVVVTMRYHGIVAAVLAGRPVVAIPGHGKVLELARELKVPIVAPSAVSTTDWGDVLHRAFDAGAPSPGDRPARAASALEDMARCFDDISLRNL
jgi:polysaccharide pyruvyl transferase CsaB